MLLRRMRLPLIVLICSYTVSILGFVFIPGQDDQGAVWRMDFFHAFYFVSFMGSTIGFGEIPYPFTDAQRLWATFAMYSTVVSWLYAIGSLLSIMQSHAFQQVVSQARFRHGVNRITEPFYIICGLGETSYLLLKALIAQDIRVVVIDRNQDRIEKLELEDLHLDVPGLYADAANLDSLNVAGLQKENCRGVLALTDHDETNLMVAISTKLTSENIRVICRAESEDSEANMASFGTDYIVNPYRSFADRMKTAIESPSLFLLMEWLTDTKYRACDQAVTPPKGRWIICGYGRFGKAFEKYLGFIGCETTIIEANPQSTNAPSSTVVGRGTEAVTLRQAKIDDAVGIIAGTDNDPNNLSIIMTAKELNSDIFCVLRQNREYNKNVFQAAKAHWLMQSGRIVARKVLSRINMPLLYNFLQFARRENEAWAKKLVDKTAAMLGENHPHCWTIRLDQTSAAAFCALSSQQTITLSTIIKDPSQRTRQLPCIPLLLKRDAEFILTPEDDIELLPNDTLFLIGHEASELTLLEILNDIYLLNFLLTGKDEPRGSMLRKLRGLAPMPKVS